MSPLVLVNMHYSQKQIKKVKTHIKYAFDNVFSHSYLLTFNFKKAMQN